jgi:hypothetical protein
MRPSRHAAHYFLFLLSLTFLSACSAHDSRAYDANERRFFDGLYREKVYGKVFDSESKTKLIQGDFENFFEATITHWNQRLRKAFVKEMARVYRMSPGELQVLESEELKENDRYFTFIVSARSRELRWRELDREDDLWRMSLENEDGSIRIRPDRIDTISEKDDKWTFFYKSMNRFSKTYRVRFPRKNLESANRLFFFITGPLGGLSASFRPDPVDRAESSSSTSPER